MAPSHARNSLRAGLSDDRADPSPIGSIPSSIMGVTSSGLTIAPSIKCRRRKHDRKGTNPSRAGCDHRALSHILAATLAQAGPRVANLFHGPGQQFLVLRMIEPA